MVGIPKEAAVDFSVRLMPRAPSSWSPSIIGVAPEMSLGIEMRHDLTVVYLTISKILSEARRDVEISHDIRRYLGG